MYGMERADRSSSLYIYTWWPCGDLPAPPMRWGSGQGPLCGEWRVWGWVGRDSDRLSCAARTPPAGCCARLSPDQRKMAAVYSFQFSCPDTEEDSAAVMGTGLGRLQTVSQGILVTDGQVGVLGDDWVPIFIVLFCNRKSIFGFEHFT